MEWIIITILGIAFIILFCLYKKKCNFAQELEKDKQNLKMAYQKGLAKEQQELFQKTEELKQDNTRLLSENKSLVKSMSEKDSLFKAIKRDNENLKDENIKLLKELQLERNRLINEINITKDSNAGRIKYLENEVTRLETLNNSSQQKLKELKINNEQLNVNIKEQNDKIERYKEYVIELNNDIVEFENAYVAIGGKLSDIYDDYNE